MADEFDRVALGSRITVGREHSVRRIRDISEPAAVELEAKFRRIREMAEPDTDSAAAKRLDKRLENIAALRQGLRSAIESEGTLLEAHGEALHIFPIGNYTAEEVIVLMVGEIGLAAADSLLLREPEFRALAEEIKEPRLTIEHRYPASPRGATADSGSFCVPRDVPNCANLT